MEIVIAFLILAVLMLWFVIGARGHWMIKAAAIVTSLYVCMSVGASLTGFAGWPTSQIVPQRFVTHWIVVSEPNRTGDGFTRTGYKGAIFVLATAIEGSSTKIKPTEENNEGWRRFFLSLAGKPRKGTPRLYRTPYSKESHAAANGVLDRIRDGKTVIGTRAGSEGGNGTGDGKGKGKGKGNGGSNEGQGAGGFSLSDDIIFQDLPDPVLPPKD